MIERGSRVIAGVSGGADSVCLLLMLHELSGRMGFSLAAVHVEHGIRGEESRRDAAFTEQLCAKLGVPFLMRSVDAPAWAKETGQGLEEAAREMRYDCFFAACETFRADRVALAHHANDSAETLLFHLARGTGIRGLCGIRPVVGMMPGRSGRPSVAGAEGMLRTADGVSMPRMAEEQAGGGDTVDTGIVLADVHKEQAGSGNAVRVIRPLLCVTRGEIGAWLDARGQEYCTDSTNRDISYTRNRIRERVLPELEQVNPQAVPHIQKAAEQLREICDYLDEAAWQVGAGAWEFISPADRDRDIALMEGTGRGSAGQADADVNAEMYSGASRGIDNQTRAGCPVRIFAEGFAGMPPYLGKHLLHLLLGLAAGSRKDITSLHVDCVLDLLRGEAGRKVSLPGRVTAERTGSGLELYRADRDTPPGAAVDPALRRVKQDTADADARGGACAEGILLRIPGETITADGLRIRTEIRDFSEFSQKIPEKRYTKWLDYDKIKFIVQLRGRRPGDYLQVNAAGGHKKLRNYLIDEKVPRGERDRLTLLADGDHIMWVIGYRISEAYKVTGETKRVLCVRVEDGPD